MHSLQRIIFTSILAILAITEKEASGADGFQNQIGTKLSLQKHCEQQQRSIPSVRKDYMPSSSTTYSSSTVRTTTTLESHAEEGRQRYWDKVYCYGFRRCYNKNDAGIRTFQRQNSRNEKAASSTIVTTKAKKSSLFFSPRSSVVSTSQHEGPSKNGPGETLEYGYNNYHHHPRLHLLRGGDGGAVMGGGNMVAKLIRNLIANVGASKTKCWVVLILSILCETGSSSLSKYAKETGSVEIFLVALLLYLITTCGFNMSLAQIEVGIAYAVWSALGTIVVTTVGIVVFKESCDIWKLTCLLLITIGVVGLNVR